MMFNPVLHAQLIQVLLRLRLGKLARPRRQDDHGLLMGMLGNSPWSRCVGIYFFLKLASDMQR